MSETKPRLGVIIGSTRATRFADKPAAWLMSKLEADGHFDIELIDLRDFELPFFNEVASNLHVPSRDPKALSWQAKIAEFDAFIFVTAEYNYSIPAALKNALDQAYNEWNRKPFSVLGYGGLGAARAVQELRSIGGALQMVPLPSGIHVGGSEFLRVHPMAKNEPFDVLSGILEPSFCAMMDQLEWWTDATRSARLATGNQPAKRTMAVAETLKAMTDDTGEQPAA